MGFFTDIALRIGTTHMYNFGDKKAFRSGLIFEKLTPAVSWTWDTTCYFHHIYRDEGKASDIGIAGYRVNNEWGRCSSMSRWICFDSVDIQRSIEKMAA